MQNADNMFGSKKRQEQFETEVLNLRNRMRTDADARAISEFWKRLITDMLIQTGIVKTDKNGNIEYNDKDIPKVDWSKAILRVWRIVAYLIALSDVNKK